MTSIDPKNLAERIEAFAGPWMISAANMLEDNYVSISSDEESLIIAALRAYEPPCQHIWDMKDGNEWWWDSLERLWKHRCSLCGIAQGHRYLIPDSDKLR